MKNKIFVFALSLILIISLFTISVSADSTLTDLTGYTFKLDDPDLLFSNPLMADVSGTLTLTRRSDNSIQNYDFNGLWFGLHMYDYEDPGSLTILYGDNLKTSPSFENFIFTFTINGGLDVTNPTLVNLLKRYSTSPVAIYNVQFDSGWTVPSKYGKFKIKGNVYIDNSSTPLSIKEIYVGYISSTNYSPNYICFISESNHITTIRPNDSFKLELFSGNDISNEKFIAFIEKNIVIPEPDLPVEPDEPEQTTCDGSLCPATDINYDNVCDDCMLMFAVPRSYNLYDYNGNNIPTFDFDRTISTSSGDIILGNRYLYAYLFKSGNDYSMYVFDLPLKVDSQNRLVTTQDHYYYYIFKLSAGSTEWEQIGTVNEQYYAGVFMSNYNNVLWTKTDLKTVDGELLKAGDPNFPQPPLPLKEVVGEATKGAMILQNLLQVMKILVLCGIGLLAFLILFGICHKVLSKCLRT